MAAQVFFLKDADLTAFLLKISPGSLFGTVAKQGGTSYEKISPEGVSQRGGEQVVIAVAPPVDSVKSFLFPAGERVGSFSLAKGSGRSDKQVGGGAGQADSSAAEHKTVVGARACDLCALAVLDKVFLEGQAKDPFYEERRQNTTIVTADCSEAGRSCFCTLLGNKPFADSGFDVNLAAVDDGFLVTSGSEKGKELLDGAAGMLKDATPEQIADRDRRREKVVKELEAANKEFEPKGGKKPDSASPLPENWSDHVWRCVECGACNFICPTCHCFLLFDQAASDAKSSERHKSWDSCMLGNYAKMAGVGGAKPTPRPQLTDRFENRVRHKFEWMLANLGVLGCVGCGRCVEACLGASDLRDIFKEIR